MSANYDERGQMTPERRAEVAKALGMDSIPKPRYDDLPAVHDVSSVQERWNFMKALACVDSLGTAAFHKYLPDRLVIDQQMNAREFRRGWSYAIHLDTSKPVPSNRKIKAATGIGTGRNESNWYGWLAQWCMRAYEELGARKMAPPLLWRTRGEKLHGRYAIVPVLGVIIKLDRTPPDGLRMEDLAGSVGILHPSSMQTENRVVPVVTTADQTLAPDALAPRARVDNSE